MFQHDGIARYLDRVIDYLRSLLRDQFVGFYVYGSLTTDAFMPGRSDIDVLGIVVRSMTDQLRTQVHDGIADLVLPPVIRGLDLSIACSATAWNAHEQACWELMLQVGRRENEQYTRDRERCDPRLPLDFALVRQQGAALVGPPIDEVAGPMPPGLVLGACAEDIRRWAARDVFVDGASGVLNTCRAWQYLEEGTLGSKVEGGQWALARGGDRDLIEAALARHRGEEHRLLPDAGIKRFCQAVLGRLEAAGP